jgi:flagellar motor switch protein FliM
MTDARADHLSRTRVRQLLAAVGSASPTRNAALGGPSTGEQHEPLCQVAEYDWRDPHYFSADQLNRLAALMSQVGARMAGTFAHFYGSEFDVSPISITQHFAGDLDECIGADDDYYLTFGAEKSRPCGFALISIEAARAWTSLLLGDSESNNDPQRAFSPLEESLLSDLAAAVVESFLLPLRPHSHLKSDGQLCQGQPSIQYELTEEICRIAWRVKKADANETSEIVFLLPCGRLAALVGKTTAAAPQPAPQELSRALMEHLQQMPVTVAVRFATTSVRFREIMDLGQGDILLLGKPLHDPAELTVDGFTVFRGRPAQSDGQYAVLVTESRTDRTQETVNSRMTG